MKFNFIIVQSIIVGDFVVHCPGLYSKFFTQIFDWSFNEPSVLMDQSFELYKKKKKNA